MRQDANLSFLDQNSRYTAASSTVQSKSREAINFSQFEISYEHLPQFINRSLAEDILFIGQTVIKFTNHDQEANRDLFVGEDQLEFNMKRE